jgi:hypothetical protein
LRDLGDKLVRLLETSPSLFTSTIRSHYFESGQRLEDFFEDFRAIGMAHIWGSLELPAVASGILAQVTERLNSMAESEKLHAILHKSWPDFPSITQGIAQLTSSVNIATDIARRLRRVTQGSNRSRSDFLVEDDLFAQRWGIPADPEVVQLIQSIMDNKADSAALIEYMSPTRLSASNRLLPSMLAIFYALEAYEALEDVAGTTARSDDLECRLIRYAALIRKALSADNPEQTRMILRLVDALWFDAPEGSRMALCLGFGHCYSIVVSRRGIERRTLDRTPSEFAALGLRRIAEFVVTHLEDIAESSEGRYAFALNFLTSNTTTLPDLVADADLYVIELARLAAGPDRYRRQIRFADTIAYRNFRRATDTRGNVDCDQVRSALRSFSEIATKTRSRTSKQHLAEAIEASRIYGCTETSVE